MRFVFGPPPDNPDFAPERNGWRLVRVPSSSALLIFGSVIGIPLCAAMALGWSQVPVTSVGLRIYTGGLGLQAGAIVAPILILLMGVLSFAALIVVHELLHAFAFPGFGLSPATILGVWPRRFLPYADHHGPLPCWRFIMVGLSPFVFLSLVPLAVSSLAGTGSPFWVLVSVVNALVSGGDALIVVVVLSQVPLGAVVRNKGWDTWWRPA